MPHERFLSMPRCPGRHGNGARSTLCSECVIDAIRAAEVEALEWAREQYRVIYEQGDESHFDAAVRAEIQRRKEAKP
jgi:hypothetical protein